MDTHKATFSERRINGRKGYRVVCSCGETWLRVGNAAHVQEVTIDLHRKVLASK